MNTNNPLLTDQYQLVMANGYWHLHKAEQQAVFHLYFRKHPFQNRYTVSCGLKRVIDFLKDWKFSQDHIAYLHSLKTPANSQLFSHEFLNYLSQLRFSCDIDAIPEGTLVFPNEPLIRISGPILQCQLLETPLINLMNFATLVATKASRICQAVGNDPVIEFGLRRAQGPDGGMMASRSAYIGGCAGTSNVLAGKLYDIPVMGTQAHSWIMSFDTELDSFQGFADAMPNNVILLVDTYNTLDGVQNAIKVGLRLRERGHHLLGIRLDSGNLAELSRQARKLLDAAGFKETQIFASGDLDEQKIADIKSQGAQVNMWGVGTRLATAYDQPALDIVYKLAAIKNAQQKWQYKLKISDTPLKITTPGIHQVRRYYHHNQWVKDVIYDMEMGIEEPPPENANRSEDLLVPIFRQGKLVYQSPDIHSMQKFCLEQVECFLKSGIEVYHAELESRLQALKNNLINPSPLVGEGAEGG